MSLRFDWEMLQFIMWNGQKIWTKKIWIKKKFELKKIWKKFFFRSEHTSSQIWCFLKFPLCVWGGGGGVKKSKLLRNAWNMVSFWNFWDPMKFGGGGGVGGSKNQSCSEWHETWSRFGIFEIRWNFRNLVRKVNGPTTKQAYRHPDTIVTR